MPKINILSEMRNATQVSSKKAGREWSPVKDKYKDICLSCPYDECKSGQCELTGHKTTAQKEQERNKKQAKVKIINCIKEARERIGLSGAELSRRTGFSRGYLYNVEKGSIPGAQNKAKIANALNMSVDEVFFQQTKEGKGGKTKKV